MKIDPEFQALIAPLAAEEREQLEANLVAHGCRDPIVVWHDLLIDGHNRFEICTRLQIKYRTVEIALPSRAHVLLWIEENQLGRRNLTDDQRAAIGHAIKKRRAALAKTERAQKGRAHGGKATKEQIAERQDRLADTAVAKRSPRDRSQNAIPAVAKQARVSERKLRAIAEIEKEKPAAVAAIRTGQKTIRQTLRELRGARRQARRQVPQGATLPAECRLYHGDLGSVDLPENSVDAVITDPPYPKEFLPVYGSLAKLAARCLKPGGVLLAMIGQSYLPEVLDALRGDGLTYHWALAYLTPGGQSPQIWTRKVNTFWKPVLWFVKGAYDGDWIGDVIKTQPNDNDKRFHEWGQSEFGMAALIERFTLPGQTILDPFVGGGTTAAVAVKLGRRFIGIDREESAIQATKARISA